MRMIFIEGVPGTGKSTMARNLCTYFSSQGMDAQWHLEEARDHPVHPKPQDISDVEAGLSEKYLRQWSNFLDQSIGKNTVHIFDGSAFQSTVRFMMEKRQPGIESYYRRFEEIVCSSNSRMVYFRPAKIFHNVE